MTAKLTPEQRRQTALDNIDIARSTLARLFKRVDKRFVELYGKSMLKCDRVDTTLVEAVLKECPDWAPASIASIVARAYEEYDDAMRKAVRAGLDTNHCVREWVVMGQTFHRSRIFRALRDTRPDLEHRMQKPPISKYDMALAEEVSSMLREEMSWGGIFYSTEPIRAKLESEAQEKGEKAPKHRSPWALQKWAKAPDRNLPQLLETEPELDQMKPVIEKLADKDSSLNAALEQLNGAAAAKAKWRGTRMQRATASLLATPPDALERELAQILPWAQLLNHKEQIVFLVDLSSAYARARRTGLDHALIETLEGWEVRAEWQRDKRLINRWLQP